MKIPTSSPSCGSNQTFFRLLYLKEKQSFGLEIYDLNDMNHIYNASISIHCISTKVIQNNMGVNTINDQNDILR